MPLQHPPGFIPPGHGPQYPYRGATRPKRFASIVCPDSQPMKKRAPRYLATCAARNHCECHHAASPPSKFCATWNPGQCNVKPMTFLNLGALS